MLFLSDETFFGQNGILIIRIRVNRALESLSRPLLKSGLQPLNRNGTHQETISRRPEQMYTPSDTRLEWLGEGPLFKSDSNKRWRAKMQPLFELALVHY